MKLKPSEQLCSMLEIPSHHRSKRKAPLMLFCFGFNILVARILVLTTVFFISPSSISPSLSVNSFHFKFLFPAHWPIYNSSSAVTTSIATSSTRIMKNSTKNKLAGTNYIENGFQSPSAVSDDLPNVGDEVVTNETSSGSMDSNCDMFDGQLVRAKDQKQYYSPGSCPYVDRQSFACYENGRPDDQYLQWKWQWPSTQKNAAGCNNVPSFLNATDFLERLRGKKMVFVGDSLNYNMYTSLSSIFGNAIPDKTRISKPSGKTEFKSRGDFSLTFEASLKKFTISYYASLVFVWSAFLVYETHSKRRRNQGVLEGPATLRLDLIDEVESSVYRDAAVVVFDSFHWWVEGKTNNGLASYTLFWFKTIVYICACCGICLFLTIVLVHYRINFFQEGNGSTRTSIRTKPKLFLEDFPKLIMCKGGRWNTGGKCNLETEPIMSNTTFIPMSPPHAKILEDTLRKMKTPVLYLNVSELTYYRADGHPSVYAKNYTVQERIVALDHQDCSHWCLPGVPDTWNELLYLSLLKAGKGSFSR
ncbi:hypothetical protein C5167_018191 [Papaver somniferum]|uniref:Uncharacterized protein n=1 Tax=Papaver somniferum TaxID=3469 RepID=A0A4Y7INS3_PAPSO|nr:hypothetical protein C5167_018191 [Papaver somniferum]